MDISSLEIDSLLLLYLTGELPEEDGAALEAELKGDAALSLKLEKLRLLDAQYQSTVHRMDRIDPVVPTAASFLRVNRAIRQRQIEKAARPLVVAPAARKVPVWGWSLGSVAAAVLVFCVWWGFKNDTAVPERTKSQTVADNYRHQDQTQAPGTNGVQEAARDAKGEPAMESGHDSAGAMGSDSSDPTLPPDSVASSMDPASRGLTLLEQAVGEEVR